MEIDDKVIRELVIKAIKLIQSENSTKSLSIPKKKLYVIFTEEWNSKYWGFFESLNKINKYDVYAVIPSRITNNIHVNNLKKFQVCKGIIEEKDVKFDDLEDYITVFPIIPRSLVAKVALCIDDTFEAKWIFKNMEKGQRTILCRSGLAKMTGKEPSSYVNKILGYYRTLLEFNIEISDEFFDMNKEILSIDIDEPLDKLNEKYKQSSKKVITEIDIEKYVQDRKIILNKGDIITELAKDRARSLNISILKM
ncbi:hypothetical protein [Clostridium sardiniense]|uniref:hypothetical protein n=1 Tax=Clostridium sardiniense TaxID=29369 RepID=UPI00195B58DF|nr:hypothetical protein [Clostridium sardiniense]